MRDIVSHLDFKRGISPAAPGSDNTALVSQILDRLGYESAAFVILTGQLADADATFAVTVEHGDAANLSDAVAVPADQLNGTLSGASFDFAADDKVRKIGYVGGRRYVRVTITPSGNSGSAPIAGLWVLGHPNNAPTARVPA